MKDLSGKRVFVLGGSGAIGFEIAVMFANRGASVTIHGGHDKKRFDECLVSLKEKSLKAEGIFEEFSGNAENFISRVEKGKVFEAVKESDILCLCMGPFLQKKIINMKNTEWESITRLNYILPAVLINAALPSMVKKHFGRIIVFGGTSTDTVRGFSTDAAYGAAKTALCSLVKSVALQHNRDGITCNAILPGQVESQRMTPEEKASYMEKKNFVRFVQIQEIVQTIAFVADNESITGSCINVDAGWKA